VTIAIALQVHDGVVLASDSASTLTDPTKTGPESVLNVYNNANKIFNLRKGLPIGGLTYGMGSIGASSISTLAKDLRARFTGTDKKSKDWKIDPQRYTISGVAASVRKFLFEEHFKPLGVKPKGIQLGFIVAGYSAGAQLSEVWTIEIKDGDCEPPKMMMGQGVCSCIAGGDPEVFCRLMLGHGSQLTDAMTKGGISDEAIKAAMPTIKKELEIGLVEAPMPIQDAIDLAEFLVNTTSTFTKFRRGASTVGGPVESAAITKHEGFKWIRRKYYFHEELNPER
jgi:hypothetical protein